MPLEMRGGHLTEWDELGQGPQPAVLIHCSLGRGRSWHGMLRQMTEVWTARVFDLPGHGNSGEWVEDGQADVVDRTSDMAASLVPAGAKVDLIGHSFGATAALNLAIKQPGLIRRLILIEPVFFAAIHGSALYEAELAINTGLMRKLESGHLDAAAEEFAASWGVDIPWQDLPDFLRAQYARGIKFIRAGNAVHFHDKDGLLDPGRFEALDLPVLLVQGERTQPVVSAIIEALQMRLPHTRHEVIPGAGHMLPLTHPHLTADAIKAFLSST